MGHQVLGPPLTMTSGVLGLCGRLLAHRVTLALCAVTIRGSRVGWGRGPCVRDPSCARAWGSPLLIQKQDTAPELGHQLEGALWQLHEA